jgi:hypothetical protein
LPRLSVLVRAWLRVPDKQPNLPDDAPALVAIQWLAAVPMTAGLASIGTRIAFGAGTRQFSMPLPVWGSLAEIIGRAVFSFGAIIASLTAAFAAAGAKKIFGKKKASG